jgi:hypothetical protein
LNTNITEVNNILYTFVYYNFMSNFEVLYYPNFEPSKKWIRSYLLFFDTVCSIIPNDDEIELSENTLELLDEIPNAFRPISPSKRDIQIKNLNYERLHKAFEQISNTEKNSISKNISSNVTIDNSCEIKYNGMSLLHNQKVSHGVFSLLNKFDFISDNSEKTCDSSTLNNFYVVDKRAADLIVSLVADNIANSQGLNTITDQSLSFTINSLNSFRYGSIGDTRSLLSYSLTNQVVPKNIESLSIEDYVQVHDKYKKIHEPFQEVLSNLNTLHRLEDVSDYSMLEKKINEITYNFDLELEELKKSRTMSNIRKWAPIGLGGLAVISDYIGNIEASACIGTASVIMQVSNIKLDSSPESSRTHVQRMIGNLQNDIISKSQIKALI